MRITPNTTTPTTPTPQLAAVVFLAKEVRFKKWAE
jgi:hypothetical protein